MKDLLFNPFKRYGGMPSLLIAISVMVVALATAAWADVHFDGVLDMHASSDTDVSAGVVAVEWLTDWLLLALMLYLAGLIFSRSAIRMIDVVGTQGMARFPLVFQALVTGFSFDDNFIRHIQNTYLGKGEPVQLTAGDYAGMVFVMLVVVACAVWTISLMYKAYSISCNVKGSRAVISFIAALLIAELLSKLILYKLLYNEK